MGRRLLIVLLEGAGREELEGAVETYGDGYPSVYVVVPANVGTLEWLATDEVRAQGEADARALEAEWLLEGQAEIGGGRAGNPDPVQAVEDALEHFDAEQIVVVGSGPVDSELLESLRAFHLPVASTGLTPRSSTWRSRLRTTSRELRSGRSGGTPWVAFVGANLGLLLIGVVASAVALLVIWLIGLF